VAAIFLPKSRAVQLLTYPTVFLYIVYSPMQKGQNPALERYLSTVVA
jgi:hypothetical protein